jgi:hypothetical protein
VEHPLRVDEQALAQRRVGLGVADLAQAVEVISVAVGDDDGIDLERLLRTGPAEQGRGEPREQLVVAAVDEDLPTRRRKEDQRR